MSFFRYPGGKTKLKKEIVKKIKEKLLKTSEYREPFFGGGSIGCDLIDLCDSIWCNDFDSGIASLWTSLIRKPDLLIKKINYFKPSLESFERFKKILTEECIILNNEIDHVDHGFKKLVVQQLSYSGLGTKGGPLGGWGQKSNYKIDCRWSPKNLNKKINFLHNKFAKCKVRENSCTNYDFEKVINDDSCEAVLYLDPPYYDKGSQLYQHSFNQEDHVRLRDSLFKTKHYWLLSYDDCDEIRKLYDWATIEVIKEVKYSINAKKTRKRELLITKN